MPDHYYTQTPTSAHDERAITVTILGETLHFTTDAGVFSRDGLDKGTEILLKALPPLSGRVLDLGCGWGAVGVTLGKLYPALDLTLTDINDRAVELSRRNLAANGVTATVTQGDGFANVYGPFDAIITNPPIRTGKANIYSLFDQARDYLTPAGALYIVIRKQQGAPSALKHLQQTYNITEILSRSAGYWVLKSSKILQPSPSEESTSAKVAAE